MREHAGEDVIEPGSGGWRTALECQQGRAEERRLHLIGRAFGERAQVHLAPRLHAHIEPGEGIGAHACGGSRHGVGRGGLHAPPGDRDPHGSGGRPVGRCEIAQLMCSIRPLAKEPTHGSHGGVRRRGARGHATRGIGEGRKRCLLRRANADQHGGRPGGNAGQPLRARLIARLAVRDEDDDRRVRCRPRVRQRLPQARLERPRQMYLPGLLDGISVGQPRKSAGKLAEPSSRSRTRGARRLRRSKAEAAAPSS